MNRNALLKRATGALVAGAALGAVVTFPSDASAWWVRQHAADCVGISAAQSSTVDFAFSGNGAALHTFLCPVPDTSATPKTALINANVELNALSTWSAKPCFADWNGSTGACDNPTSTSGTGHKTIALGGGNTFWDTDTGADFGFIWVDGSGDSSGRLAGVFYSN